LRHLQVLQRANRGAEPGVVANGQQNVALGSKAGHKVRVHHFIANKWCDLITLGLQHGLLGRAAGKVGHRQIKECDHAAQNILKRYVFAKWHQFLLQVNAIAFTDGCNTVEESRLVTHFLADRYTGNQR